MLYFLGKMVIVGIAHIAVGVFLYYGRIKNLSAVLDSDLLVFVVPALLAFCGYVFITWSDTFPTYRLPVKLGLVALIALVATAISFTCAATVAFDRFGT